MSDDDEESIEEHVRWVVKVKDRDDIGCATCREATRLGLWPAADRMNAEQETA